MREASMRSVLQGICRKDGLDTEQISIVEGDLTSYVNTRVRRGWTWDWWPELMLVEHRQYRDDYSGSTSYVTDDIVWDPTGKVYYIALQNSSGVALSNTAYWSTTLGEWDRYIPYEQTGETKFGEIRALYSRNPRISKKPGRLNFELSEKGIQVSSLAGNQVWVEFRLRPYQYTNTLYNNTTANYYVGDLVYDNGSAAGAQDSGHVYECIQAHTNSPARTPDNGTYWSKRPIPFVIEPYVVHAAYADFLAAEGQTGKSIAEEGRADDFLEEAVDLQVPQQHQHERIYVARGV